MPAYREEGRFVISVDLAAEFGDDYEGDADGYAWLEAWKANVRPRLLTAVMTALRADPAYVAVPVSRGKNPDSELEVSVRFAP
jgi:hypothetical protein